MAYAAAAMAAGSIIGGIASKPKAPKSYIPRKETLASERMRINARNESMYGPGGQQDLYTNPDNWAQYGPRPFSDINGYEEGAIEGLGNFATQEFPGLYQDYSDTVRDQVMNGGESDRYSEAFGGLMPQLQQEFSQRPEMYAGGNVDFQAGVGNQTTADPNAAINRMLSGNLDTEHFQGAMNSYLQPIMEQYNEQLLPGMFRADAAATGGQSSAGALKAAQRVQEQIGEGANAYGQGLLYNASQSALNRMGQGAGMAQQGRAIDVGNQLAAQGMNMQNLQGNADRGLGGYQANAAVGSDYRSGLLQGSGYGASSASDADRNRYAFSSQMPDVMTGALAGPQALGVAGAATRAFADQEAGYNAGEFNYYEQQPFQMGNAWQEQLQGAAPPGGVPAQTTPVGVANPTAAAINSGIMAGLANYPQRQSTAAPAYPNGTTSSTWKPPLKPGQTYS